MAKKHKKTDCLKGAVNWQAVVIGAFIIVLIGVSVFFYENQEVKISFFPLQQELKENNNDNEQEQGFLREKTDEEIISEVKDKFLPQGAEFGTAAITDLNNDNIKEVVLGARIVEELEQGEKCFSGFLTVVELSQDGYEKIGEFGFEGLHNPCGFSFISPGIPKDPETNELRYPPTDFDADGIKEIITWLPPGASHEFFGILKVDFEGKKIDWLMIEGSQGEIGPLLSLGLGGSVIYSTDFLIRDTNGNGIKEIIAIACYHPTGDFEDSFCNIEAYEWNKEIVAYNAELSSQFSIEDFY